MTYIVKANTPEEMLLALIKWTEAQASSTRISARISNRKTAKKEWESKAATYDYIAKMLTEVKIVKGKNND